MLMQIINNIKDVYIKVYVKNNKDVYDTVVYIK